MRPSRGWRSASATGGNARPASTPPRPPSSCRSSSTRASRPDPIAFRPMRRLIHRHRAAGRRLPPPWPGSTTPAWTRDSRAIRASISSSRSRRAPALARSAARWSQAGVVRDELTFRLAVFLTGTERELKAGEYRFAGRDVGEGRRAQAGARRHLPAARSRFPEGLTLKEMARVYESRGLGSATAFLTAASRSDAHPGARSAGEGSRRVSVSRDVQRAAQDGRRDSWWRR